MVRVRTEAKRDAILEAAAAVFQERGLEGASMSEIAKRLGGSKATLYGYFPSKEVLFVHVTLRVVSRRIMPALTGLRERGAEDPRTVLFEIGKQLVAVITSPEAMTTFRLAVAHGSIKSLGQIFYNSGPRTGIEAFSEYLAAATKAGRLTVSNPTSAAHHLQSLLESETHWASRLGLDERKSVAEIDRALERAIDVFLAAYRSPATPDLPPKIEPKKKVTQTKTK